MSKKHKPTPVQEAKLDELDPQAVADKEVQIEAAEVAQAQGEPEAAQIEETPVEAVEEAKVQEETKDQAPQAKPEDKGVLDQSTKPAAPVQAPVSPTPKVEKVKDSAKKEDVLSEGEAYLDNIREKGTEVQKRMLAAIETFAERLRPKVEIDAVTGSGYQVEFLDHLLWLLGKEDYEEFRKGWNVLLVYFQLYHGVNTASNYTALSEFSTTRFLHAWTKGEIKANAYRNLVTLLRATRDPATRKHNIVTIDLAKVGDELFTETELNNLKRFYGV